MSTPVINAIDQLNQSSLEDLFASVANNPQARDNLSQSNRNIDKVSTSVELIEELNASEDAILRMLCRREGRDPANFADLDAVAADQGLMEAIASRQQSSKILARSQKASAAAAASQTAMQEMINSTTAMQEIRQSPTADSLFHRSDNYASTLDTLASINTGLTGGIDDIALSQNAMQQVANSQTAMQQVVASSTAMQEVANSQTAMDEIGNSATARSEVYASETALSEIRPVDQAIAKLSAGEAGENAANFPDMATLAGDATAMQGVVASSTAMQEVANSQTAMAEIDQVDFAVRAIMCGTTTLDPTDFANADAISQDAAAMSEIAGDATTMNTLAASQTAMQEVANSQTAINEIGSNENKNITANTVLNSSTATTELKSSNLEQGFNKNFNNARNDEGTITNSRILVTSNNNGGDRGTGISFSNDVGPETQGGTTFIVNGANSNGGNNFRGGDIGFSGIEIE